MAFKFVVALTLMTAAMLSVTHAGVLGPITYSTPVVAKVANPAVDAVASTHQNVVRSFDGTVSQYSKSIDTPYSSVRKEDTRISNNVYTPAIAKTVAYAAPAPTATTVYNHIAHAAPSAAVYEQHYETAQVNAHPHQQQYQAPAQAQAHAYVTQENVQHEAVYNHESVAVPAQVHNTVYAPAVGKTVTYAAQEPAHLYNNYHQAPAVATTTYNHGPDASTYTHNAPGVAAYGSSQTVRYSPANMVSHMSFDGFGTHWGF